MSVSITHYTPSSENNYYVDFAKLRFLTLLVVEKAD